MPRAPAIAVIDIGKSNAKLAAVDPVTRATLAVRTTPNGVRNDGPYPHYDVERLWAWLIDGLAAFARDVEITTICVTTHGAAFALLAGDALALPILDYEHDGPEQLREDYAMARGDFAETLSPDLPNGLNAGRQLWWQARAYPDAFGAVDAILPYPQYWAWRLSGAKAAEVTSLGCHTDLWNPRAADYSALARREGWDRRFPKLAKAWDTVGTLLSAVSAATGIAATCRVVAGIHDSNASLLPHVLARRPPFAVLSSGTWMICFAVGGNLDALDPARDCLANVNAFGDAVPSSRFMAGREYEILGDGEQATADDIAAIVASGAMILPTFAPGTGPFPRWPGRWTTDAARLTGRARAAAASLYAALVTGTCLALAGADGPVIVEGPFARNAGFLAALARLVPRPVLARPDATGTTDGAALLAMGPDAAGLSIRDPAPVTPLAVDLAPYCAAWLKAAAAS
jgi:sugar (pentulose or hexulose) kinase